MPIAEAESQQVQVSDETKPSKQACRDAIENIHRVMGIPFEQEPVAAIRSCVATSNTGDVECIRGAKTAEALESCNSQ